MSAEDDDDDIWNSDNFIATIEVFLQKAEHESAVKHGTQSVIPTASSNFPATSRSIYSNGPTSKFGPTSADPKPSYGSSAAGAGGRVVDYPNVGPDIRADDNVGRKPVLQPLNYQNPWIVPEVRDVYTTEQCKGQGHDYSGNLQISVVENESPALRDILAEKDGAISLLRTRLREAEQQVEEFRRRVSSQTSLQPAISQQRELERLYSQLLFKEHEVNEVQRVRLEKEEQLKDALAEAAALSQELERLKQSRSTGGNGLKRPADEVASPQDNSVDRYHVTSRPSASIENNTRTSELKHDPWTSPWMPEKTFSGPSRTISQGRQEKNTRELSNLQAGDASPAVATLKRRTAENGCVPSSTNESNEKSKAVETYKRETSAQFKETGTAAGISELSYSMQQIWGFKGAKNDGKALVTKIYASCAQDLYILLSNGENKRPVDCKTTMERRKSESCTASEKFHRTIAKVTSGSALPEIILGPLLEFCNTENSKLLGSALRVLHCILQHDESCRQRLVGRRKEGGNLRSPLPVFSRFKEKDNGEEAKCGFKVVSKIMADGETKQVPVFTSPRIIVRSKGGKTSETGVISKEDSLKKLKKHGEPGISVDADQQQLHEVQPIEIGFRGKVGSVEGTSDTMDPSAESVVEGSEGRKSSNQQKSPPRLQTDQYGCCGGTNPCDEELEAFLKWMLHLTLTSASPAVRLEAVAIIGVLVVHSEPHVGRLMFGSLLLHEGLGTLLKESAGVEIQLQAVRIVHHLLHCPALYRKMCSSITEEQTAISNSKQEFCEDTRVVVEEADIVESNAADERVDAPVAKGCTSGPSAGLMTRKLLSGLAECLTCKGTSLQGYALRRNVMRLITYIASCGDAGVAFLMQPVRFWKSGADESIGICKDDGMPKPDGMPLGESSGGQHIAGDGFKVLDARGRMIPGTDESDIGLPDNREDLEKVMNFPERLVTLLGAELGRQDGEEREAGLVEERACLIREVATLLCCLASHPVQSGVVLGYISSNPRIARLTLSVTNDLVNPKGLAHGSLTGQKHARLSSSETAELCRSLRRRVMRAMTEVSEPQS